MKKIRFTVALVLLSFAAFGQWQFTLNSAWSFGGDAAFADAVYAIVVDNDGFITVAGQFSGSGDFDPHPTNEMILTSAGGSDIFVARYTSAGALVWAYQIGGPLDDGATALALESGDPVIVGTFMGSVDFDPDPDPSEEEMLIAGGTHGFILKLTSAGDFIWARQLGGAAGTAVDPRGIVVANGPTYYIAGHYIGNNVDFDPGTGTDLWSSSGDLDIFVAYVDGTTGDGIWNESMGGNGPDRCFDLTEALNSVFIVGTYTGDAGFVTTELTNGGAFVAQMASNGDVFWAARLGSPGTVARSIAADESNILSIGGEFTGSQDFDPDDNDEFVLDAQGPRDGFIVKLDDDGDFQAASRLGGPGDDYVLNHATDGDGNVYSVGVFSTGADFDPNEDPGEEYFLSTGGSFISILSESLAFLGARAVGDNGGTAYAIAGNEDRIITTGQFSGTVDFDVDGGEAPLTAQGSQDAFIQIVDRFIAEIDITLQPVDVYTCQGTTPITFTTAATGTTNITYRWYRFDPDMGAIPIDNGSTYSGVTTAALTINVSTQDPEGYYFCEIFGDGAEDMTTNVVELLINPLPPFAPDVTRCGPGEVTLVAFGNNPGNYRWYTQAVGGTPIAGEVNGTYITPPLTASTPFWVATNEGGCEGERTLINANISTCQPAPGLDWVKQVGGQGAESGDAMARDASGNTYIAGTFSNAITDFDPGPGVETLPYVGGFDMYILKLDPNGDFLWVKAIAGSGNEFPVDLKVDASGALYLYFEFRQTPDVDPGPVVVPLASTGTLANQDVGIVKLDNDGNYQWSQKIGSSVNEYAGTLELDANGNPYIIGMYQADITISTTTGPVLLDNIGGTDVFVIRMNPAGEFIWAKSFGGTETGGLNSTQEQANDIAISATHVIVTGLIQATSPQTVDFDPGAGTANRLIQDNTAYVLKLTTDGDFVDVYLFAGDAPGFSTNGLQVEVDASGTIYTAGNFIGTGDFDPSAGVFELTHNSAFSSGSYLVKLAADGSFVWAKSWNPSGQGFGFARMKLSSTGDIYSLISVGGIVDADPGPLEHQVHPNSLNIISVSVLKLSNNGEFNWIVQAFRPFNISSGTTPGDLIVESNGDVYVAGRFSGTVDFDPHLCQSNLVAVNNLEGFVYKLSPNAANICIVNNPVDANSCGNATVDYTVEATGSPNITFAWEYFNPATSLYEPISNGGRFAGATTATLTVEVTGSEPGEGFRAIASATGADDQTSTTAFLSIGGSAPPPPTTTGETLCAPGFFTLVASGGVTGQYRWYTAATGGTFLPGELDDTYNPFVTTTTTFFVALNNGTCESARVPVVATVSSSISPPTATGASTCATSASLTLTAAGGVDGDYRWYTVASGGTPISGETNGTFVTPTLNATTSYYVSIANGTCESARSVATAIIDAAGTAPSTTNGSHCGPGPVTLTASGGTNGNYLWYTQATGGTPIPGEVNSTYLTPVVTTETTYYVSIAAAGCESARTPVDAVILTAPAAPTTSNATICGFGAISVAASGGTDGSYRWYTQSSGGTPIANEFNNTYITPNLSVTTTYYVSIIDGSCESPRAAAVVQLVPFPDLPGVTGGTGCPAVGVTLNATGGNAGEYRWYTVATGGTPITGAMNSNYNTGPIASTTTYYVSVNTGVCEGPRAAAVATIVNCDNNQPPAITQTTATTGVQTTTTIALLPLLTDPDNNLDLTTLRIVQQPASGALASIDASGSLTIDYTNVSFAGDDEITIEICDLAGSCAQRVIVISVVGDVAVYNAVSPNGDGKNDVFFIQFIDVLQTSRDNKVTIFNRWGDVVFEIDNYDNVNRVFTGKSNDGKELPSGTYYYKIEFRNGAKGMTGYLSLVK